MSNPVNLTSRLFLESGLKGLDFAIIQNILDMLRILIFTLKEMGGHWKNLNKVKWLD